MVWNSKASISVPLYASLASAIVQSTVTRTVGFELEFVDGAAGSPYPVTCNHTKTLAEYIAGFDAMSQPDRDFDHPKATSVSELRTYSTADPEWKKRKFLNDVTRDHNRHGTPHLQSWGDQDSEAVQHEFGHAIGLPDEYNTTL